MTKVDKVVESCVTPQHCLGAAEYVRLSYRAGLIDRWQKNSYLTSLTRHLRSEACKSYVAWVVSRVGNRANVA